MFVSRTRTLPRQRIAAVRTSAIAAALAATTGFLAGCPSADPPAKLDSFLEETQDERDEAANMKMDVGGTLADISGTHLFALSATLSPTTPLQFIATIELTSTPEGGTMSATFQPLSLDITATTTPREMVGDPLTFTDIPVDAGGGFTLDFGSVGVVGAANPITGADIEASLQITGAIQNADLWCGTVTGAVTVPLDYDLVNSSFAAVRVEDTSPAGLPMDVVYACPEGGEESGSGGMTDTDTDTDGGDDPTATSG